MPRGDRQEGGRNKTLQVGWGRVVIDPLKPRPTICYRCLGVGHVRAACKATVDRSSVCFRCGVPGHIAKACSTAPRCLTCEDLGLPAGHRFGGPKCNPRKVRKRDGEQRPPKGSQVNPRGGGTWQSYALLDPPARGRHLVAAWPPGLPPPGGSRRKPLFRSPEKSRGGRKRLRLWSLWRWSQCTTTDSLPDWGNRFTL